MHERFACDLDVELETSRGRIVGRGRDMSDSAVCLTTNTPVEPGTQVQVHLRLVLEWGASEAIIVPGQVVWLTDTEGSQQIGVAFSVLATDPARIAADLDSLLRMLAAWGLVES